MYATAPLESGWTYHTPQEIGQFEKTHSSTTEVASPVDRQTVIGLLQRVSRAEVSVAGERVGAIERGLVVLIGVEQGDSEREADRLLERLIGYRVFADAAGKMNLSVQDVAGGVLLVPQFTLAADTSKGMRPSFSSAASPDEGRRLFEYFVQQARARHSPVATGRFGADMKVSLTNDGPVTFWLQVPPSRGPLASRS